MPVNTLSAILPQASGLKLMAVALLLALSITTLRAGESPPSTDEFMKAHKAALALNPRGVRMWLKFPNGRKQYRIGELIEATLEYNVKDATSFLPDTGEPAQGSLDNPGSFNADPSGGVVYPDKLYREKLNLIFNCQMEIENSKHHERRVRHVVISKWLRFTAPGHYRIYLSTTHSDYPKSRNYKQQITARVTSAIAELDILPIDELLLDRELQAALSEIKECSRVDNRIPDCLEPVKPAERERIHKMREHAYNVIAYQDTPASLMALLPLKYHPVPRCGNVDYEHGLLGTTHPDILINEFLRRINDPDTTVEQVDLNYLSRLKENPELRVDGKDNNPAARAADTKGQGKSEFTLFSKNNYEAEDLLAAQIANKRGMARAMSLITLEESTIHGTSKEVSDLNPPTRDVLSKMAEILAPEFGNLESNEQEFLLEYRWRLIRSPAMIPVLERLAEPEKRESNTLPALALERLYQLDPVASRRLLAASLKEYHPRVSSEAILRLPDKPLDVSDVKILENLRRAVAEKNSELIQLHGILIGRFGSGAMLDEIRSLHQGLKGADSCSPGLLAYFFARDPEYARTFISRKKTDEYWSCGDELYEAARTRVSPALLEQAIKSLQSDDPKIAADAAKVLGRFGSGNVKDMLWKRLEAVHRVWQPRDPQASFNVSRPADKAYSDLEEKYRDLWKNLYYAIGFHSKWVISTEEQTRLTQWCMDPQAKSPGSDFNPSRDNMTPIMINRMNFDQLRYLYRLPPVDFPNYSVGHYTVETTDELKEKVLQYPRGSAFRWLTSSDKQPGAVELVEALRTWIEARGMTLSRDVGPAVPASPIPEK